MDYVGDIIETCREFVGESDYSETNGIAQSVPLRAFNHAQNFIQGALYKQVPSLFDRRFDIPVVPGQDEYSFPENLIGKMNILSLKYYPNSSSSDDHWNLVYVPPAALNGGSRDHAVSYTYSGGGFVLDPKPMSTTSLMRLWAARALDRVDLRRGLIKEVETDGTSVTLLKLDVSTVDYEADKLFARNKYLCVCDVDGNVVASNVSYTWDASAKELEVTIAGSAVTDGQYVTIGKNTRTHSELDDVCSTFIDEYVQRALVASRNGDSLPVHEDIMQREEVKILAVYRRLLRDKKRIPYYGKFD